MIVEDKKKTCILIRTSGKLDAAIDLLSALKKQWNDTYLVIDGISGSDEKTSGIDEKSKIYVSDDFIKEYNLKKFYNVMWQAGDYFYYAARKNLPNFDYYWLIDDDVFFNIDFSKFILKSEKISCDLLGMEIGPRKPNWWWYSSMEHLYGDKVFGMLYPLSRLSGKAIDFLLEKRSNYISSCSESDYSSNNHALQKHANDEAFTATTLLNNNFSYESLYQNFKYELSGFFSTERPILEIEKNLNHTKGKILHPVVDYIKAKNKFDIMIKKYGYSKFLNRMDEIVENCGEEIWLKCCDIPSTTIHERINENESSIENLNMNCEIFFTSPEIKITRSKLFGEEILFATDQPKDLIQAHHLRGVFYEPDEIMIMTKLFPIGGNFLDIGANIGNHSIFFGKIMKARNIKLIECNKRIINILKTNIIINNISEICDITHLGLGLYSESLTGASIKWSETNIGGGRVSLDDNGMIEMKKGDDIFEMKFDLVKIDVEGFEMEVLKGMSSYISKFHPNIFIEVDNENSDTFSNWLTEVGYEVIDKFKRYNTNENFLISKI